MKKAETVYAVLYCFAALFLYFFLIPQIPIWSTDEGRYAEIAREMWHLRDFVVPHFNYVDYLEKPILAPALTAVVFELFGDNALSSRLIPICSALFGLALTYGFSCKLFSKRVAGYSVIVLLATVGYVLVGRFAVIDMLMTAVMSAALFFIMLAYFERKSHYYLAAYVFIGLSVLTKGLIGIVLPGLIFLIFLIGQNDLKELRLMHLLKGSAIVGFIVLPWFICVSVQEPEFFRVFILEHHFTRFATGGFGRVKPVWFYLPVLLVTAFPWTLFLPAAIADIGKVKGLPTKEKLKFLLIWICVILVFFSLPKSKLPYYLLPVAMPMAMLIGFALSNWCRERKAKTNSKLMGGAIMIILLICFISPIAIGAYYNLFEVDARAALLKDLLSVGGLLLFSSGLIIAVLNKINKRSGVVLTIAVMVYGILLLSFAGMKQISPFQSTFDEAGLIMNRKLLPSDMVAIYASPDRFSDLPFHLKRRIVIVGSDRGTIGRESREERHLKESESWFYETGSFIQKFNLKTNRVFLVSDANRFEDLLTQGLRDYEILSKSAGRILVVNTGGV